MRKKILSIIALVLIFLISFGQVALAADIKIETVVGTVGHSYNFNKGIYWTSNTTGYFLYTDTGGIFYEKTTDGGLTWGSQTNICSGDYIFDTWADWNTPGDSGTKIHILGCLITEDDIFYTYLDTFNDTYPVSPIIVEAVPDMWEYTDLTGSYVSITKSNNGELAVAYRTDGVTTDGYGFEISEDGGSTWVGKASPWENAFDHFDLYPANETDPSDLWGVFWDISANELSLKTYDSSGNSWSEQLISTNMYDDPDKYINMSGDINHHNGHLYLAAWNKFSSTNTTLNVWEINGAANMTALTPVIENGDGYFQTDIFIDPPSSDLYVAYLKGAIESDVNVYYQKSEDNGATWDGEVTFSQTNDDHRAIWTSGINVENGGRYMPVWLNDDPNAYYTNNIRSLIIYPVPRLVLYVDGIEKDYCQFFGEIPDDSNDWIFCANGSVIYMKSANITIGGNEISQWDWEYDDTTFQDSIGNNDAYPTFRTSGMSGNVTGDITAQQSLDDQGEATQDYEGWDMVTENFTEPANLFSSGGTNFPGGPEICAFADSLRIPCIVFLVILAIGTSLLAALAVYAATFKTKVGSRGSLLAASMAAMVVMIFWVMGGDGVIPGWILAPYGLIAVLMLFWRNPFGNPIS